jgi:hypothetical protein
MNDYIVHVAVASVSSIVLIIFIGLILFLFAQKSPGMALCLIGVFMSIAAAVQASASGIELNQNPGQMMITAAPGTGPLTKVAVMLVLGGVGTIFLSRPVTIPTSPNITETPHVA